MSLVLFFTGLALVGALHYEAQSRNAILLHGDRIAVTARLLAGRLAEWRRERLADARALALIPALEGVLHPTHPDGGGARDLEQSLDGVRRQYACRSIAVFDGEGRLRLAVPAGAPERLALEGLRSDETILTDTARGDGRIPAFAFAAVRRGGTRIGFVRLESDLTEVVARLKVAARTPGRAPEVTLLREHGGAVQPLVRPWNEDWTEPAGHSPDTLLASAAAAFRDHQGVFEALDRRRQAVLAFVARVPGAPWLVLATTSREEALAANRESLIQTGALIVMLIGLAGTGIHLSWRSQLRAATRELAEARRRYDLVFKNALNGIAEHEIVQDEAGKVIDYSFVEANPAFERLTGLKREDILGRRVTEVLPGIEQTPFIETYGRVVLSGEAMRFDSYAPMIGRHYEIFAFPLGGVRFCAILADTTPQKEAQAALVESEAYLRALFERALDPIVVADDAGCWVELNPATTQAFGYAKAELLGRPIREFVADSDFDALWQGLLEAGMMTGTFRGRRGDGTVRTFEFAATARVAPGRHLALLRDVTERSQAEQALKDSETLSRLVLETIPVGVWLLDRVGRVTYANPAARRIWGGARFVGPEEFDVFKGWRLPDRIPIPPREWGALRALEKGVALFGDAIEIQAFDGVRRQILYSALPIRDEGDAIVGVLVTNEDVTEQRRLEQQFQQSQKMEAVGRLAGGVAHDFNNLLAIVAGRGEALKKLLRPGHGGLRHVEQILEATERASALTRQLLAFGRKEVQQRRPLRVNDVVEKLAPMLERLLGEDLQLRVNLAGGLDPVLADVHQLEQVLMNLAVNARDAMPDGGTLTITTSNQVVKEGLDHRRAAGLAPGRYTLLEVGDTGQGMDAETRSHMFEPFFTTKPAGQGTGLGLSTVYGIVTQSGGHISVDSEPGKGTIFRIHLSVTDEEVPDVTPAGPASRQEGNETILVVEDERSLRDLIQEELEDLGYTVLAAGSPDEALELAATHPSRVDLVLTDVILPRMNGRELVARLSESHTGLRAVYMSGYSARVIARHGVLEPGVLFLQKPFPPQALGARIREALDIPGGS